MAAADQLHQEFPGSISIIEWHYGDEFATDESVSRIFFYGINGLPTSEVDGILEYLGGGPPSAYNDLLPLIQERLEEPSNFNITIQIEQGEGTDYNVTTTWKILDGSNAEDLAAFVVVTESDCFSPGNDNQNFVGRKIYPDENGNPLNFSIQSSYTLTHTITIEDDWIPENCEIVAFLQNMTTKEIYQGSSAILNEAYVGVDPVEPFGAELTIYPNPVNDVVNINSGKEIVRLEVYDRNGRVVYRTPVNTTICNLNVKRFSRGLYFFRVTTNDGTYVKRVVVE